MSVRYTQVGGFDESGAILRQEPHAISFLPVGREAQATADPQAKEAVLRLTLPVGVTTLEAWFADAADAALCGGFFVTVCRSG